jgi:hypothetical protein
MDHDMMEYEHFDPHPSPKPTSPGYVPSQVGFSLIALVESKLQGPLCFQLKRFLGEDWVFVVKRQVPWDVLDILYVIKSHWIAVFSDVYPRLLLPSLEVAEKIVYDLKKSKVSSKVSSKEVMELLGVVEMLFMAAQEIEPPQERTERISLLEDLKGRLNSAK